VSPIGENSATVAKKILRATEVLLSLTEQVLGPSGLAQYQQFSEEIHTLTARGRDVKVQHFYVENGMADSIFIDQNPVLTIFLEGAMSICGAAAFLLASKLPAEVTPDQAMDGICSQGLLNDLAFKAPTGFLMPKILAGRYIQNVLSFGPKGVSFSSSFSALLTTLKEGYVASLESYDRVRDLTLPQEGFVNETMPHGFGCPVAFTSHSKSESGLEVLSKSFGRIYQALSEVA